MVSCLFHRARTVAQGSNIRREEQRLTKVLKENGYPAHIIRNAAKPKPPREPEEPPTSTVYIPYVAGLSEDLRRICKKHNIRTIFKTPSTLRHQLMKVKDTDPMVKRSGVVYQIPCGGCGQSYIGETKRPLETRLKEHIAATTRGEIDKSAIAEHAWICQHQPLWKETRVLDVAVNNTILLIKEAMHIQMADAGTLMNRDPRFCHC